MNDTNVVAQGELNNSSGLSFRLVYVKQMLSGVSCKPPLFDHWFAYKEVNIPNFTKWNKSNQTIKMLDVLT